MAVQQVIDHASRISMRTRFYVLIILGLSLSFVEAQTNININLNWTAPVNFNGKDYISFEDGVYNEKGLPQFMLRVEDEFIEKESFQNEIVTPLPLEWKHLIPANAEIGYDFIYKKTNKAANSGNYSVIEVFPFRFRDGQIEILISAQATVNFKKPVGGQQHQTKSAANSVLANGTWLKIGVANNGLYRLTHSELQNAGLFSGSVSSDQIHLHGNGGGALPEENSKFRYDDLEENAIMVVDGGDGNFDGGDYILFYGQGPHQWLFNWNDSSRFYHINNVYADTNFYFITIGTGPGLRLTNRTSLGGVPTYTTSTGDGYLFKEDDLNSLTHSGRQWVGDHYNFNNSYTYSFNLDNLDVSDSVMTTVRMASRCVSCPTTINVQYSSSTFLTLNPSPCSSSYTAPYATTATGTGSFMATGSAIDVVVRRDVGDEAWLDYIEINYRKNITAGGSFSVFSDKKSIGEANAQFNISNTNNGQQIWDITDPLKPIQQEFSIAGSTGSFQVNMDTLRSFVIFEPSGASNVASITSIANQNLHALTEANPPADLVIVTHPAFLSASQDLANFHTTEDNMVVHVVTTDQIYNEYSSGKQDISAIRDFVKMYYDKHPSDYPPYLLLMGDGSFDYKPYLNRLTSPNTNFVPAFETLESFDRGGGSYCSDDFYALLDSNEGSTGSVVLNPASNIDVGVGRIPARDADEAQGVVNKIKRYASDIECMRDWRNYVTVVADDNEAAWEDSFFTGSESISTQINGIDGVWNIDKIYLDAYEQVSNAGQRYPEAEVDLYNRINKGSLIINYIGHGGETGFTAERVIQSDDFLSLINEHSLPAFTTATCTFTRFDNPDFNSAGEYLIQTEDKGAIGLFSTIRPISIVNYWNQKFYNAAFNPLSSGEMPRMGDIIRLSKQPTNDYGEQNILLFGDPALRLSYPQIRVVTDSINGIYADTTAGFVADTLMASQLVTITGHIEDNNGAFQGSYNGDLYTSIFDKASQLTTLGNDGGNTFNFELRKNVIFKGKTSIVNGRFTIQFIVPLDINYLVGEGKISYYGTDNNSVDAHGFYQGFNVGGSENNCSGDITGPDINIYFNDTNFVEMGITQTSTRLVVKVSDPMGINTTGLGIGHNLQAIIDGDIQHPINLNDYYEADNNSYTSGTATYFITGLSEGIHTVEVQVWDGCNNPSSKILNFAITNADPAVINMIPYPNPFNDMVTLAFEHNFEGKNVTAEIDIMDVAGQAIRRWTKSYVPGGNRDVSFIWDGTTGNGTKVASGVYICRVVLSDDQGNQASACCKVILVY